MTGRARSPINDIWSRPMINTLTRLWAVPTNSASMIGRELGLTKNQVIGKVHTLRLPSRPSPILHGRTPGAEKRSRIRKRVAVIRERVKRVAVEAPTVRIAAPVVEVPPTGQVTFRAAVEAGGCQWFYSDGLVCGSGCVRGRRWCAGHAARATGVRPTGGGEMRLQAMPSLIAGRVR